MRTFFEILRKVTTQTSVKVDEGIDEVRRNLHTAGCPVF
jgi:hypothetical protein